MLFLRAPSSHRLPPPPPPSTTVPSTVFTSHRRIRFVLRRRCCYTSDVYNRFCCLLAPTSSNVRLWRAVPHSPPPHSPLSSLSNPPPADCAPSSLRSLSRTPPKQKGQCFSSSSTSTAPPQKSPRLRPLPRCCLLLPLPSAAASQHLLPSLLIRHSKNCIYLSKKKVVALLLLLRRPSPPRSPHLCVTTPCFLHSLPCRVWRLSATVSLSRV